MANITELLRGTRRAHEPPTPKTKSEKLQALLREYPELRKIPQGKLPTHMLIIPDGNGRWAAKRHLHTLEGHRKGKDVAIQVLRDLRPLEEIRFITLWGMSAANFDKRDPNEKANLFWIFEDTLTELTPELMQENGRFIHLGRKDRVPAYLLRRLDETEKTTARNTGQTVCLAVDYGGQDQEERMYEHFGKEVRMLPQDVPITNIPQRIVALRDGGGTVPTADLVVRTSGELRTSGLGWLGEQAEFVSVKSLFPSIGTRHIVEALVEYSRRDRRSGGRPVKTT